MIISTGKSDWGREVTETQGTLAAYLADAKEEHKHSSHGKSSKSSKVPGVFNPEEASRVLILNGSHRTICEDSKKETVLVFPDYKLVTEVERSPAGAEELWETEVNHPLDHEAAAASDTHLKSWVIPYSCVILLCK